MTVPFLFLGLPFVVVGLALAGTVVYAAALRRSAVVLRRDVATLQERHATVLRAIDDGVYVVDGRLRVTDVNAEAARLMESPASSLAGRTLDEIVDPLASELVPDVRYTIRTGKPLVRFHTAASGALIEVGIGQASHGAVVTLHDRTERARTEAQLREQEQRLRLVTENVDAVIWTTDRDARFTSVAGAALDELGLRAGPMQELSSSALIAEHVLRDVVAGTPVRAETARGERWLRHHIEPLLDACGAVIGAVGVSVDVTELKRTQQQLFDTAHRDKLTGLPNRLSLAQRIEETIEDARRDDRKFALLFVDLDRFHAINDSLGHGMGDELLREVAVRLQETLRAGDVIARPGGDEFIILLPHVVHRGEVESVAQRIALALARPVSVRGRELFVNASVGAAIFPEHGRDAEAIVAHADAAMFRAKKMGGNGFALYDRSMEAAAGDRVALENDLRHAVFGDELELLYQPVVDLKTRRTVGCEALVRWHHRTRGIVAPAAFIPIAEESGVIVALDRWVLREACGTVARMRSFVPDFKMSVNLSPRDLREPDLPDVIAAMLAEHGLPPSALSVEVSEHVLLDDTVLPALRRICTLGVHVAIDDFGVGYSSLAYLKRLPITALKIDRAFIREVAEDAYDQAIVGSIISVAKTLGLHVTAEGVEHDDQAAFVAALGCDEAQGFRFAAPLSRAVLEESLARRPRALVERGA